MEILQLKYFCKIAETESMSRAAEELRVSQPSLSRTIKNLESELGVQLFNRTGKYIRLNRNGQIFLNHAQEALTTLREGAKEIKDRSEEPLSDINLLFLAASHIVPDLIKDFRKQNSKLNFNLLQHVSGSNYPDFDLCISALPLDIQTIESIPLLTEELFLAVPASHPLAEKRKIRLIEAAEEGFINLKPGNSLREITDFLCKSAGFSPQNIFESDNPSTVRGLIRAGQGVAFLPSITWEGSIGSSVVLLQIEEPICKRTIGLSWRKNRYIPKSSQIFRDFTIDYFSSLSRQYRWQHPHQ